MANPQLRKARQLEQQADVYEKQGKDATAKLLRNRARQIRVSSEKRNSGK